MEFDLGLCPFCGEYVHYCECYPRECSNGSFIALARGKMLRMSEKQFIVTAFGRNKGACTTGLAEQKRITVTAPNREDAIAQWYERYDSAGGYPEAFEQRIEST